MTSSAFSLGLIIKIFTCHRGPRFHEVSWLVATQTMIKIYDKSFLVGGFNLSEKY